MVQRILVLMLGAFGLVNLTFANPIGGIVSSGSATISQSPGLTQIQQQSNQAIINWDSFNIGTHEKTEFIQPSSHAIALNRINPNSGVSEIYGSLTANGKIILVNQSGIYFGPNSHVDVAALIASTANISDANFLANKFVFEQSGGDIVNAGYLQAAEHGLIALVGNNIRNDGIIEAHGGNVLLAAGKTFVISFDNDQLVNFVVDDMSRQINGNVVKVSTQTAEDIVDRTINLDGIAQAQSVTQINGDIILTDNSIIDVSASIGDAGKVIVLGTNNTFVSGNIFARGQTHGGFVETSGNYLNLNEIHVDTRSENEKNGTWLLDPTDVTINGSATSGETLSNNTYTPNVSGSSTSNILASDLTSNLANNDITVTTTNSSGTGNGDITVSSAISWSSSHGLTLSATRNIVINAAITNTGGANVNLVADNTGSFTGTGTSTQGKITGTGSVTLSGGSGVVSLFYNPTTFGTQDSTFYTNTGGTTPIRYMLINQLGASSDTTTNSLASLSNHSAFWSGNFALGKNIDASATSSWNSGTGLVPIGNSSIQFTGNFNGNNYAISNLYINRSSTDYVGLFGYASGTLQNLVLLSTSVTGQNYTGALVGYLTGTVTNSFASGTVSGASDTGGFAGHLENGTGSTSGFNGTVAGSNGSTGGFAGYISKFSTLSTSWSGGSVSGTSSVGGLIGYKDGIVTDAYSTASVTGSSTNIGGLIGFFGDQSLTRSWSSGAVSGSSPVGGLIGGKGGGTFTNTNNFWDTNTSGFGTSNGCGYTTNCSTNVTGKTTSQMTTLSTFSSAWGTSTGATTGGITNTVSTSSTLPNFTWFIFDGNTRPMLVSELGTPNTAPSSTTLYNSHQLQLVGSTLGGSYILGTNIDLSTTGNNSSYNADIWGGATINKGFVPIGNTSLTFTGNFNGNGNVIDNLYINNASNDTGVGLFGATNLSSGNIISNIGLLNENITGGELTGGLVGQLVVSTTNSIAISSSFTTGTIYATRNILGANHGVGGLVGTAGIGSGGGNPGISNSFSTASVSGDGSGGNDTGGLAGTFGGAITNSWSSGLVTAVTTGGYSGGLAGINWGGPITNSFWNTETSGQSDGLGNGSSTGMTTAQMMTLTNFQTGSSFITGTGWDISASPSSSIWGIINGKSYPYLTTIYGTSTTPRAISGSSNLSSNTTIQLASGGNNVTTSGLTQGTTTTGANGFYYFLEPNGTIADSAKILVSSSTNNAYGITVAATSGGSITGLNINSNTVSVGDNSTNTFSNNTSTGNILPLSSFLTTYSSLPYSLSGNNLTIGTSGIHNISLLVNGSNTTYSLDGNITTYNGIGTGGLTFSGPVSLTADSTLTSASGGITFSNTIDGAKSLSIANNSGTTTFGGVVGGTALTSLTIGTSDATTINTAGFTTSGAQTWNSAITLGASPTFSSTGSSGITFGNTINGAQTITIANNSGTTTFNGIVGGSTPLTSLVIIGTSNSTVFGSSNTGVTTTGAQTYNSSLTLNASTTTLTTTTTTGDGSSTYDIKLNNTTFTGNTLLLNPSKFALLNGALSGGTLNLNLNSTGNYATNNYQTGSSGTISVSIFNLLNGGWSQSGTLPSFSATNFQLNSGGGPSSTVQFLRITGGSGTSGSPYLITDKYGLQGIDSNSTTLGQSWQLANDIDASGTSGWNSGTGFIPIGLGSTYFSGSLSGSSNIYTISNLYMNDTASYNWDTGYGLISQNTSTSIIQNFNISNATLILAPGNTNIINGGLLIGNNNGSISNVSVSGSITTGSSGGAYRIGGIVGTNGISSSTASISGSHSTASLTATTNFVVVEGGLVGAVFSGSTGVTFSFSHGSVQLNVPSSPTTQFMYIGGFVGENQTTISDSYSFSPVTVSGTGSGTYAGGFVGAGNGGTITRNFVTGVVSGPAGITIGGFAGSSPGPSSGASASSFSNNFWDTSTTGQSGGIGNGSSSGMTGMTTANMMTKANFNSATTANGNVNPNWIIADAPTSSTWGIIDSQSYPYLTAIYGTGTAPRAISGTSNLGSSQTIQLADNGSKITSSGLTQGTTLTGSNGFYYFLEPSTTITNGHSLLVYSTTGTNANAITLAPSSGNSITGLTLTGNTINLGDSNTNAITNTQIGIAKGSLSSNILFSVSSANLTINSSNALASTGTTTYNPDGNLTMGTGLATFSGPVSLAADSTFTSTSGGFIFSNTVNGAHALSIANSSGTITFGGIIGGSTPLTGITIGTSDATTINTTSIITAGNQNFGSSVTLGSALTLNTSSGTGNTLSLAAVNIAGFDLTLTTAGTGTQSGVLSGSGALTLNGTGTFTLSQTNSYGGGTTVSNGTLSVATLPSSSGNSTIGTGNLNLSNAATLSWTGSSGQTFSRNITVGSGGATINMNFNGLTLSGSNSIGANNLQFTNADGITISSAISGTGDPTTSGTITLSGSGFFSLNATTAYPGPVVVSSGTLQLFANNETNTNTRMTINSGGRFKTNGRDTSIGSLAGDGELSVQGSTLTVGGDNSSSTFSGLIDFSGNIIKTGTGTLTISGTNNQLTGSYTVSNGILAVTSTNALGNGTSNAASVTVSSGGELDISNVTLTASPALTLNGTGYSNAALYETASSGTGTYNGTITLGSNSRIGINSGGTLALGGTINGAFSLDVTSGGAIKFNSTIGNSTALSSLSVTGNTTISSSASSITTSGNQNYTGTISVNTNTALTSSSGSLIFNNAINGANNLTLSSIANAIALPAITLTSSGALSVTAGGNITQSSALSIAGTSSFNAGAHTITLTQNNNFTGAITLSNSGANNVSLTNSAATSFATSTIGQNFTVSTSGAITQAGALSAGGTSSFSAGSNAITLTNSSNNFSGAIALSNSGAFDVSLTNNTAISLATSSIGRNLTLISGGSITQTGAITATATTSIASTAANSDILFTQANNFGSTPITFSGTLTNIRDVSLRNINSSAVLPSNLSSLSNLRNFSVQFDNTPINIANSLTTSGTQTYATAVKATGNITLTNTGDIIFGSTLDDNSNGAHSVIINSSGVTTFNGNIGNTFALASITTNNAGSSVINANSVTTTGNQIYNNSVTSIGSTGTNFVSTSGGAISLANTSNNFTTSSTAPLRINISGGTNNATIYNANTVTFGNSNISGALNVSTTGSGNAITQVSGTSIVVGSLTLVADNSPITLTGNNTFNNLNVTITGTSKNDVTVNDPSSTLTINNMDTSSGGGDIIINNSGSIVVNGSITSGTGAIQLNANLTNASLTINNSSSVSGTGGITYTADNMFLTGTTNGGTASITLLPYTSGQSINLGGANSTGTLGLSQSILNTISGGALIIGNNTASPFTFSNAISSNNMNLTLVGSGFINNVGNNALSTGSGQFLIWTIKPQNNSINGLQTNFEQFSATYGTTTPTGTGNGLLYSLAPTDTLTLTGTVEKLFNNSNNAILSLNNYFYNGVNPSQTSLTLSTGDIATISLSGLYAQSNPGNGILVSANFSVIDPDNSNAIIYGYNFSSPLSANIGVIDPSEKTTTAVNVVTSTQTTNSSNTSTNSSSDSNSTSTTASVVAGANSQNTNQTTSQMVTSFISQQTPQQSFSLCN